MTVNKSKYSIKFERRADKNAHKSFLVAIEILGGPSKAAKLSGVTQSQISIIKCGRKNAELSLINKRKQEWPTPDQAMRISIACGLEVTAEELLPHHDFKHTYKYTEMMNKRKKK